MAVSSRGATSTNPALERIAPILGECFARLFSEARAFARMKMLAFASFLTFVGLGFVIKLSGLSGSEVGARFVEFILASPTTAQVIAALLALLFVLLANIYSRTKRQEYELELIRIADDPSTSDEVRRIILKRLGRG